MVLGHKTLEINHVVSVCENPVCENDHDHESNAHILLTSLTHTLVLDRDIFVKGRKNETEREREGKKIEREKEKGGERNKKRHVPDCPPRVPKSLLMSSLQTKTLHK